MQSAAFKILNDSKELSLTQKQIEMFTITNAYGIQEVITPEGIENNLLLEDKIFLLNNIIESEMVKITKWYEDNDFGLDFTINLKCPHCNKESKREVPLEDFFF
jgi:hypothetical protein